MKCVFNFRDRSQNSTRILSDLSRLNFVVFFSHSLGYAFKKRLV